MKYKIWLTIGLALMSLLFLCPASFARETAMEEIRFLLKNYYVTAVSEDILNSPTPGELIDRLGDRHTGYFTADEYSRLINSQYNKKVDLGINIGIVPEGALVLSVLNGSPGEEAHIKQGDIIVEVSGSTLKGLGEEKVRSLLCGEEGSVIEFTLKRNNETITSSVTCKPIEIPTVTGEVLDGHIGYIDINFFGRESPDLFERLVENLQDKRVDSWIIDLRDNPGGYLTSTLKIAGYFIGDNLTLLTGKNGVYTGYRAEKQGIVINQPVVFLINNNSASGAEIISAAVKYYKKAVLVGTNTHGKGTVQNIFHLKSGGYLKMTMYEFYTPDGAAINGIGIAPDIEVNNGDSMLTAKSLVNNLKEYQFALGDYKLTRL
ncbi:carboxyl-terminal protease [Desulfocucumis palustris]|uniref:Carboxyl-terminal protease n=1 Tax=Desulfocucumis palustris TaxID=1898651 RepID=A0A2L2XI55_9FIRM|nr:S41 family peptidase [Desulfocucumis palustris]GBF33571.1 carboxyl-terminal protease [Desulfocucumis palustris]